VACIFCDAGHSIGGPSSGKGTQEGKNLQALGTGGGQGWHNHKVRLSGCDLCWGGEGGPIQEPLVSGDLRNGHACLFKGLWTVAWTPAKRCTEGKVPQTHDTADDHGQQSIDWRRAMPGILMQRRVFEHRQSSAHHVVGGHAQVGLSSTSHPLASTLQSKMRMHDTQPRGSGGALYLYSLVHSSPLGQQLLDHLQVSLLGGYVQRCCTILLRHQRWSAAVSHRATCGQPGTDAPALVPHSVSAHLVTGS